MFAVEESCMKLHLTNAEVGLRPVGAIEAYAPEGMWPPARRGHKGLRPGGNAEGWSRCALSL